MKSIARSWLSRTILTILLVCITQYDAIVVAATKKSCPITTSTQRPINRALLIFLDDSESDDAVGCSKIGAISDAFLCAFVQQAGPIIVSASIIDNVRERENSTETDPQKLVDRFRTLQRKQACDDAEFMEQKNIKYSLVSFNENTAFPWIIKKINDALYLLIPKHYLEDMHIAESEVADFTLKAPITLVEQTLGLKVNHMQTVLDINEIEKPLPAPIIAQYFIGAIYDNTKNEPSAIFVTNAEYYKYNNKNIPLWSIYVGGHGLMGMTIADLPLQQFKSFLSFLERGIHTRLLYYLSCYGAGINSKIVYKDAESGVDKAYPFVIITHAITDAPVVALSTTFSFSDRGVEFKTFLAYNDFVHKVINSEVIDYKELVSCFVEDLEIAGASSMLPQVKLPGIPWFSVIHEDRVCSIGTVLAKTRTKPLNVETFFARKGKHAAPLGILLYAQGFPFELIVDTKTETGKTPAIISMIPGNAIHHIKRLSSQINSTGNLLLSFLQIDGLGPQKIFIIDEIKGQDSDVPMQNVVIKLTPQQNMIYYTENNKLFKTIVNQAPVEVTIEDEEEYAQLLSLCKPKKTVAVTAAQMNNVQAQADVLFAEQMMNTQVHQNLITILDAMPNVVILRISKIRGFPCPPENEYCWYEPFYHVAQYASPGARKVIWIDELEICREEGNCQAILTNIIVDVAEDETKVLFTINTQKIGSMSNRTGTTELPEGSDYITRYATMFQYFKEHLRLPEQLSKEEVPTIQDLLTRETVVSLEKVQEKKQKDIKSRRNRNKSRARSKRMHCND